MATWEEAAAVLEALAGREVPLVTCLPLQPGSKEPRYAHLLSGLPAIEERAVEPRSEPARLALQAEDQRIAALEQQVETLRGEVEQLRNELAQFKKQFD
jgi:uncharacterized protein YceH (UPF0502 family)